ARRQTPSPPCPPPARGSSGRAQGPTPPACSRTPAATPPTSSCARGPSPPPSPARPDSWRPGSRRSPRGRSYPSGDPPRVFGARARVGARVRSSTMGAVDVVVVGSGPAGLASAAEVKRRGLGVVVLERGDAIAARWRSRYAGLRLNTFRPFSRLPGVSIPREVGRYASRDAFVSYLDDYARRHQLEVRCGVEAEMVDPDLAGGWRVSTSQGTWSSRSVVVATGWDAEPVLPEWARESPFAGVLLHTSQLRDLSVFARQRVLVV